MLIKQLSAIAIGLILVGGFTQPPAHAQATDPAITTDTNRTLPSIPSWMWIVGSGILLVIFIPKIGWVVGLISVGESEVGIITKKFSTKNLPLNRTIALNGEAGLQADTLPPGWHFGYFPW